VKLRLTLAVVCVICAVGGGGNAQGGIRIGVRNGNSYTVTVLPLDTYVARVLAGEAAPKTAPAALEALAIAVRTYTAANMGKHRAEGFDLCDQTHCQVMRTANPDTERASHATAGLVLFSGTSPATIYYSASCGGRTELPSAVWPGSVNPPHLPSRDDDACKGFPAWSAELAEADLQRALAAAGIKGTLRNMRITSRNASGRVDKLALDGMTPSEMSGQDLRMAVGPTLGWLRVLSTNFELRRIGTAYRFTGRGSGHGVGMCVIGAMHRAEAGESAASILSQYYPGLEVAPYTPASSAPVTTAAAAPAAVVPSAAQPPPAAPSSLSAPTAAAASAVPRRDISVVVPPSDAGERTVLESLIARARDDLSRTLAIAAPPRLAATFHPSASEYERASGHPWYTSGSVVDGTLHFLPVGVLRDRGVLERTVRRGLTAQMTAASLEGRPAWIREGVAAYFADPQASAETRGPCPTDTELAQPLSAGALSDAYARARACVARQIADGRSWRELR
jgi:stage II sporulation protein D